MSGSRTSFFDEPDLSDTASPAQEGGSGRAPETIEEIASRVLFAGTIEEKLAPFTLVESTSTPSTLPVRGECLPGRPDDLRFAREHEARPALPTTPSLVEDRSRGVLLHFFANHELLAAELMALALLKFPDAPPAFRRGLLQTLREEQIHTGWYCRRMRQCGVSFGQYPVSKFFWDAVSTMEDPLDYVSRLSLTFEQANLDYSRHFSGILAEAGDEASASILERIYRDEISHVGYGLHWFRQWKEEGLSDWEALRRKLLFPLSPSWAKARRAPFNLEGRRRAGLDEDYIRKLSIYERSRGRTPNVYYFNPEAENRIAALPEAYHPPERIQKLVLDLELLAGFLARRDDVVLLRRIPTEEHVATLREAGFPLPECERLGEDGGLAPDSLLRERKVNRFRPWSRTPDLETRFSCLGHSDGLASDMKWRDSDRELFDKTAQAEAFSDWFGAGHSLRKASDLRYALADFRDRKIEDLVWKPGIASAGSGMRRVSRRELEARLAQSDGPDFSRTGPVRLEPWQERVFDFSMQFQVENGEARLLGPVEQIVTDQGGYRGTLALPKFCSGLDAETARFLMTEALPKYEADQPLLETLREWALAHRYEGPVGIDSYLFRDSAGGLRHRPVCEVNFRFTMGRVAYELRKAVAPGHGVRFEILRAPGPKDCPAPQLREGRMVSGALRLTEPDSDSRFLAVATVGKRRADLCPWREEPGAISSNLGGSSRCRTAREPTAPSYPACDTDS